MKRVIPVVLIEEGRVIKTRSFSKPRYIGDPLVVCKLFEEKEADEILLLDRGASRSKGIDFDLISTIVSECFIPISYGGGVANINQVDQLIRAGVDKVVINTNLTKNISLLDEIADRFGAQVVIAGVDFKKDFLGRRRLVTDGGRKKHRTEIKEHIGNILRRKVGELLLTDIDREGSMQGFDMDNFEELAMGANVPVIISGGAGDRSHILSALGCRNISAVGCGSFFVYSGPRRGILVTYDKFDDSRDDFEPNKNN